MTAVETGLDSIQRQHPEWQPWLTVIEVVLGEIADAKWDAVVPHRQNNQTNKTPLLAGAKLNMPTSLLRPTVARLLQAASRSSSPTMATLSALAADRCDTSTIFRLALDNDSDALKRMAASMSVDIEAFAAVAALVPIPFLQACNRAWATAIAPGWMEAYCPICGSWPIFAEVRGIERSRYLRCGRCGAGWQSHGLSCAYCGMNDHKELVSLVPENNSLNAVIDACKRCLGYVKSFTKLQGSKPTDVMIDDLASVELDVAAADQGYKRPLGAGYLLNVSVAEVP